MFKVGDLIKGINYTGGILGCGLLAGEITEIGKTYFHVKIIKHVNIMEEERKINEDVSKLTPNRFIKIEDINSIDNKIDIVSLYTRSGKLTYYYRNLDTFIYNNNNSACAYLRKKITNLDFYNLDINSKIEIINNSVSNDFKLVRVGDNNG